MRTESGEAGGPIHLLWVFSTFALGGPQRRFLTLAEALGPRYRHSIFAMDGCFDAAALMPAGVEHACIEGAVTKGGLVSRANLSMVRGVLSRERPDLLLTSNWGAIEWFMANRGSVAVPQVHFEDGFGPDERPDAQKSKRVWMRRLLFRKRGVRFVAPSHVLHDVYVRVWGVGANRVSLIPNGVDHRGMACAREKSDRTVVGTVAALRPEKRIDRMVDAFADADIAGSSLLIVGDGPERAALEAQAEKRSVDAQFVGNRDDVGAWLAQMDLFAMSSDTEQMPISLVEAMMAGLPLVATDVGDIRRMVCDANGRFVVPLDSVGGLSGAMRDLAANAELRAEIGAANAVKAQLEYGLEAMVTRYDTLFSAMTGRDQSARVHQTGT